MLCRTIPPQGIIIECKLLGNLHRKLNFLQQSTTTQRPPNEEVRINYDKWRNIAQISGNVMNLNPTKKNGHRQTYYVLTGVKYGLPAYLKQDTS